MKIYMTNYVCEKCERTFTAKASLIAHLTVRKKKCFAKNECKYCNKLFYNSSSRNKHLKTCKSNPNNIKKVNVVNQIEQPVIEIVNQIEQPENEVINQIKHQMIEIINQIDRLKNEVINLRGQLENEIN